MERVATRDLPSTSARAGSRDAVVRVATIATTVAAVLAFGLIGLLAMLGPCRRLRRRRAATCGSCRRTHRVWLGVTVTVAVLTVAGAGLRFAPPEAPRACSVTTISGVAPSDHVDRPGPLGPASVVRSVLTAPASGLAMGVSRLNGQTMCDMRHPAMTLTFVPGALTTGGSTIGDVFITPWRPDLDRRQTEALARHEARHSDQWAVATALGGMTLLPIAYLVDQSLYPGNLNHFEQSAGLAGGGYPPVPSPAPGPRPWAVTAWALLACVCLRSRIRVVVRFVTGRPAASAPDRCARHSA
jgi:hypothetical protein